MEKIILLDYLKVILLFIIMIILLTILIYVMIIKNNLESDIEELNLSEEEIKKRCAKMCGDHKATNSLPIFDPNNY